jgi:hypothetical protein
LSTWNNLRLELSNYNQHSERDEYRIQKEVKIVELTFRFILFCKVVVHHNFKGFNNKDKNMEKKGEKTEK